MKDDEQKKKDRKKKRQNDLEKYIFQLMEQSMKKALD